MTRDEEVAKIQDEFNQNCAKAKAKYEREAEPVYCQLDQILAEYDREFDAIVAEYDRRMEPFRTP